MNKNILIIIIVIFLSCVFVYSEENVVQCTDDSLFTAFFFNETSGNLTDGCFGKTKLFTNYPLSYNETGSIVNRKAIRTLVNLTSLVSNNTFNSTFVAQNFSIVVIFNLDGSPKEASNQGIFSNSESAGNDGFSYYWTKNNPPYDYNNTNIMIGGGVKYLQLQNGTTKAKEWILVIFTYDYTATNLSIYINNTNIKSRNDINYTGTINNMTLANLAYNNGFGGIISFDEWAVYSKLLSQTEINHLYSLFATENITYNLSDLKPLNSSINLTNKDDLTNDGQICGWNGTNNNLCGPTNTKHPNFIFNTTAATRCKIANLSANYSTLTSDNSWACSDVGYVKNHSCTITTSLTSGTKELYVACKTPYIEINTFNESNIFNITINNDIIIPNINFSTGTNFFNNSIISGYFYNLSYNITVSDVNLFGFYINVSCDRNGTLFYWEILDINTTSYNKYGQINLTENNYPSQRCDFLIGVSDDHTETVFSYNKLEEKSDGVDLNYKNINFELNDINNNIEDIKTTKEEDRVSMNIKFLTKEIEQTLQIKADKKVYPRKNSIYPGHFVVWDDTTKSGLWTDLNEGTNVERDYTFTKINDNTYNIKIKSVIPKNEIEGDSIEKAKNYKELKEKYGFKELDLHSIGGTNVVNLSTIFYIGSVLNTTTFNIYDNTTFSGYCVNISTVYAFPEYNTTICFTGSQGYIVNLTNGTYFFKINSTDYFDKNYTFVIPTDDIYKLVYNTSQGVVNIRVHSTSGKANLTNVIYNLLNVFSGQNNGLTEPGVTASFYLNASNYNLTIGKTNYLTKLDNFSLTKKTNITLEYNLSYLANFFLKDEKTLDAFDINKTNSTKFILFCPDGVVSTLINGTTSVSLPIDCVFDKFEFVLDYGSLGTYYRVFKYTPDEITENLSIYLIDLTTTSYVVNSFITEDLFSTYNDKAIYIKRIINSTTVQITADEVDVENKLTAYLIANYEYIIEVHSSNQPTRIIGNYIAAFSGTKNIRLYDFTLTPEPSDISSNTTIDMGKISYVGVAKVLTASYNDSANQTNSIIFKVYNKNISGVLLNTIITTDPNVIFTYTVPVAYQYNTLLTIMNVSHLKGNYLYAFYPYVNNTEIDNFDTRDSFIRNVGSGSTDAEKTASGKRRLNLFITLLLGFLALTFTIKTRDIGALFLCGLGVLLAILKFFTISWAILIITLIIALIVFIKRQGDE